MKNVKVLVMLVLIALLSGCLGNITGTVPVMYVNVSVTVEGNKTIIQNIDAKAGEVPTIKGPGMIIPEHFPAIYAEVLQPLPDGRALRSVSLQNGQVYTGAGNYSFTVQLMNVTNKSLPIMLYSEIINSTGDSVATGVIAKVNWIQN